MTHPVRRRLLISGRVQGVYFRDSVRHEAFAAGVCGSARNLPDGRVEVVLEGDPDAVRLVSEWCRKGPAKARVDEVEMIEEPPNAIEGFTVS